jgi:hypothetical protein
MERNLDAMPGIEWSDKELLGRDMVSVASVALSLTYPTTIDEEDHWTKDTTATIDEINASYDADSWELLHDTHLCSEPGRAPYVHEMTAQEKS